MDKLQCEKCRFAFDDNPMSHIMQEIQCRKCGKDLFTIVHSDLLKPEPCDARTCLACNEMFESSKHLSQHKPRCAVKLTNTSKIQTNLFDYPEKTTMNNRYQLFDIEIGNGKDYQTEIESALKLTKEVLKVSITRLESIRFEVLCVLEMKPSVSSDKVITPHFTSKRTLINIIHLEDEIKSCKDTLFNSIEEYQHHTPGRIFTNVFKIELRVGVFDEIHYIYI